MVQGPIQLGKIQQIRIMAILIVIALLLTGCDNISQIVADKPSEGGKMTEKQRLDTRLADAIASANLEAVKEALEDGADIDLSYDTYPIRRAIVPYEYASDYLNNKVPTYLLEQGANLDFIMTDGATPLTAAAFRDDVEQCESYLHFGANIEFPDKRGFTSVDSAASSGAENALQFLISKGARVTEQTLEIALEGSSSLSNGYQHYGAVRIVVQQLLAQNEAVDLDELVLASITGDSAQVIELCNSGKLTEENKDWVGYNAAAFCTPAALEACVDNGFTLEGASYDDTPLMTAAQYNNIENVKWIMERKENDGDSTDYRFRTLQNAIGYNHYDLTVYLLEIGTPFKLDENVSISGNILWTAAKNGNLDIIEHIINHYDEPIFSGILLDAISDAIRWGQYHTLEPLLQAGALTSEDLSLNTIFAVKNLDALKLLVSYGADIHDESVMMYAVTGGYYDTVEYLIENGCAIDFYSKELGSPIREAVQQGFIEIVELLIANGANVNETSEQFGSLLMIASKTSRNITQLLLDSGADVNYQHTSGNTALIGATSQGRTDCVKILLEAGADGAFKNNDGQTALDIAKNAGYNDIVEFLN